MIEALKAIIEAVREERKNIIKIIREKSKQHNGVVALTLRELADELEDCTPDVTEAIR